MCIRDRYKRDLRIRDNNALFESISISNSITSIYIFDKNYPLDFNAESRAWFLGLSLKELSEEWIRRCSRLLFAEGDPICLIPHFAKIINAKYVAWNKSIEPYEIKRDKKIKEILEEINIKVIDPWDNLLLNPTEIATGNDNPYSVYGPFYKKFKSKINQYNFLNNEGNTKIDNQFIDIDKTFEDLIEIKSSNSKLNEFIRKNNFLGKNICPVSYTHLTLPTILLV